MMIMLPFLYAAFIKFLLFINKINMLFTNFFIFQISDVCIKKFTVMVCRRIISMTATTMAMRIYRLIHHYVASCFFTGMKEHRSVLSGKKNAVIINTYFVATRIGLLTIFLCLIFNCWYKLMLLLFIDNLSIVVTLKHRTCVLSSNR